MIRAGIMGALCGVLAVGVVACGLLGVAVASEGHLCAGLVQIGAAAFGAWVLDRDARVAA